MLCRQSCGNLGTLLNCRWRASTSARRYAFVSRALSVTYAARERVITRSPSVVRRWHANSFATKYFRRRRRQFCRLRSLFQRLTPPIAQHTALTPAARNSSRHTGESRPAGEPVQLVWNWLCVISRRLPRADHPGGHRQQRFPFTR